MYKYTYMIHSGHFNLYQKKKRKKKKHLAGEGEYIYIYMKLDLGRIQYSYNYTYTFLDLLQGTMLLRILDVYRPLVNNLARLLPITFIH